jgi:hypothetical protein
VLLLASITYEVSKEYCSTSGRLVVPASHWYDYELHMYGHEWGDCCEIVCICHPGRERWRG